MRLVGAWAALAMIAPFTAVPATAAPPESGISRATVVGAPSAAVAASFVGYAASAVTVKVGGEVRDSGRVSAGNPRPVTVEYRKKGTAVWRTRYTGQSTVSGAFLARYKPVSKGTWEFRLVAPPATGKARVVSAVRTVRASGKAATTTVTGYSTKTVSSVPGRSVEDRFSISPRQGTRLITVQYRKAGTSRFVSLSTSLYLARAAYGTYTPPSPGTWQFRVIVNASKTAKARTLPVRTIIGKPKLTPVVTGWETTPITLGFGQTRSADARVNIADGDELVMVTEARASLAPGAWGPWVITDERGVAYWDNGTKIAVPGPGTWQVRIRTQSSATYNPVVSSARTVTMAPPACSVLRSAAWNGLTYHECEVVVRPSASIDQNVYVLHYTGPADLAALSAPAIVSYFHGDGGDPRWPRDGTGIHPELMSETEAWALGRGYLWVGAISPLTYQGAPWWGATQGLFHWTVALNVGRDVAALGRFVGAAHYAYYGHSGGSWFLGEAFLPAGIQEAPGPVAMNCGSSSPWPPEARTARPYGIWWWLPSRDASIRTRVPLQFNVGDQDFLFDTVTGAHSNYKRMGFTTERNVYPGVPHCGISFDDDNIRWFSQHMPTP